MKKHLLAMALLLLPFLGLAQKEAPLLKEFGKKTLGIINSVQFSNHAYAVFILDDEENSELAAVDDKMQELWRLPLKGAGVSVGKFKGDLLAYTRTTQGKQETLTAYIIDPKAGKIVSQKVVYDVKSDFTEQSEPVFNEQGSIARLVVRESGSKRNSYKADKFRETRDLTIIDLDEKLGTSVSKPPIPPGNFIKFQCNEKGDLFILSSPGDNILKISKYDYGKSAPAAEITQNIDLRNKDEIYSAYLAISKTDNNRAYTVLINNNSSKDKVLTLCKFDFGTQSAQVASTPFDKQHLKSLEKNFVPLYKKMPEPEMGSIDNRSVGHVEEYNGNLLVSIVGGYVGTYQLGAIGAAPNAANTGTSLQSFAVIIAGFDLKLQPKFEQVLPVYYQYIKFLQDSYHGDGNYYDILASNTRHDKGAY